MSDATTELVRVGFFREMRHAEPTDPSLAEARRSEAHPDEANIAAYLDAGHVMVATPGTTHDVFEPSRRIGPPHYLTDGHFVWPGDVAHYVRAYHVALPARFVDHARAQGFTVRPDVDVTRLRRPSPSPTPSPSPSPTPSPSPSPSPTPSPSLLLGQLTRTLATATATDHAQAAAAFRDALAEAGIPIASPDALTADLRRALTAALGAAQTQVSDAVAAITAWLDHPDPATTAQVQALVDRLDAATADDRAADHERRQRGHAAEARAAIAARLRKAGLGPGGSSQGS